MQFVEVKLDPQQGVVAEAGSFMMMDDLIKMDTIFGGEAVFFATLTGPGAAAIQSLPFSRLADRILANAPSKGGSRKGEGSVLGGLGDLLDGDNRF